MVWFLRTEYYSASEPTAKLVFLPPVSRTMADPGAPSTAVELVMLFPPWELEAPKAPWGHWKNVVSWSEIFQIIHGVNIPQVMAAQLCAIL